MRVTSFMFGHRRCSGREGARVDYVTTSGRIKDASADLADSREIHARARKWRKTKTRFALRDSIFRPLHAVRACVRAGVYPALHACGRIPSSSYTVLFGS